MLHTKKLFLVILLLGIVSLSFINCAQEKQKPKEITITTSSEDAMQSFLKGRDLYEKVKFPQAADMFDKAIKLDQNFAMAYLYRAITGGGYKIWHDNLEKAVSMTDKVSDGEKHLILYYQAAGNNNEPVRIQELDSLLKLYPKDKRVQQLAGIYYYFAVQEYPKALEHFNKSIKLDDNFAPAYNMLGYVDIELGNFTAAEKAFKKYIQLIPDEANPYDSYAEFLLRQGRYDESINQYNKALKTDPEFLTALVGIGNNYVFKGDYDTARKYYQQSYDKAFSYNQKIDALYNKAVSYVYENKIADAIKVFDEESKIGLENNSPTSAINGYRYSEWLLDENNKFDEAEKYLSKTEDLVKKADLSDAVRKTYKINIGLDKCYIQILRNNFKDAEKDLEALTSTINTRQNSSEKEYLNFVYGILQFKKGNYNKAIDYFDKANKGYPNVWYWQAMTLEKLGKKQEANYLYSKIVNYNVNGFELALIRGKAKGKL